MTSQPITVCGHTKLRHRKMYFNAEMGIPVTFIQRDLTVVLNTEDVNCALKIGQ